MNQTSNLVGKNVAVIKADEVILDSINFSILPGTITGLIGPSGSGKTMLMRAIVGVQIISKGTITLFNKPVGSKELRQKVGYVTQIPAIYSDLTVWQNLRYFATLARTKTSQIDAVMDIVRLTEKKNQLVEKLSGGQRARVSLAIALLGDPDVLIMDEPTVGLDPILRQELWGLFENLAKQGKTILVSSHVMDEAERCSELLLLRDGKLLWADSKNNLLQATGAKSVEGAFIKMISERESM